MAKKSMASDRPPSVVTKGLRELKLIQAELLGLDSQLRHFAPLRDRLGASGQDANAVYRKIESRRDQLMAQLKKLTPAPIRQSAAETSLLPLRLGGSVLSFPIAPPRFYPPINGIGFGFSGTVQMGRFYEGIDLIAQGKYPVSGSIYTVALDEMGGITFDGDLAVGPPAVPESDYDPTLQYFWLHNWNTLIFFPAPPVASTFTYSFDVAALANIFLLGGPVTLMAFASVGETANYTGQDVEVNTDVGWPLVADLTQPDLANGSLYNGSYGSVRGQVAVQRSFAVGAGQLPAVAVVLGVVSCQAMQTEVRLDFPGLGDGYLGIGSYARNVGPGLVNFNYNPLPLEARQ